MKFPTWTKVAAVSVASFAGGCTTISHTATGDLRKNLQQIDGDKARVTLAAARLDSVAAKRLDADMDIHSALLFYCDPKISHKIAGVKSADGPELVRETQDSMAVWQVEEQRYQSLAKLVTAIDPDTKMQICATYDAQHKDMVLHFGGTDFSNGYDLMTAAAVAFGGVGKRAADGGKYALQADDALKRQHPELRPGEVTISIVAHSQGGGPAAGAIAALAARGETVNKTALLAPFGAKTAFAQAERDLQLSPQLLERGVSTVTAHHKGVLDMFSTASAAVGRRETCDAAGHMGLNFITGYNKARLAAIKPNGTGE